MSEDYLYRDLPYQLHHPETDRQYIAGLFVHAKQLGASDIYIKSFRPVVVRLHGRLEHITDRVLQHHEVGMILADIYGDNGVIEVARKPMSLAYTVKTAAHRLRFRIEATATQFDDQLSISIVARELPPVPPKLDRADLGGVYPHLFPDNGLVLICGETGSGKSTLMAGIVRDIMENENSHKHIVEFAHPIEFVYDVLQVNARHCEVDQSEVPRDVPSFADGIRNALRRDPDIIMVGEARDAETIKTSLLAAQTGHGVYTTLHANTVAGVFLRLIQSLPIEEAPMILGGIIDSIRVIICQELLPSLDGKRVAIRETLVFDDKMRRDLIFAAQESLAKIPLVANELVKKFGVTRQQAIQQRIEEGVLSKEYGLLVEVTKEVA